MGKKLAEGAHTRVPVSPSGPPRNEQTGADGNTTTHDGHTFQWDQTHGAYKCRIPEDTNPPGPWSFLEFHEDEGYDLYEQHPYGSDIWTENGRDYANG